MGMTHGIPSRYDLKRKSGDLPPGEDRGAIDITTQWFFNPAVAGIEEAKAKAKAKKAEFGLANWLQEEQDDTETESVCLYTCTAVGRTSTHFFI